MRWAMKAENGRKCFKGEKNEPSEPTDSITPDPSYPTIVISLTGSPGRGYPPLMPTSAWENGSFVRNRKKGGVSALSPRTNSGGAKIKILHVQD